MVGTKAQFIKTAPIIRELDRKHIAYQLVYTGQHSETFDLLESAFSTRPPDTVLVSGCEASTNASFLGWTFRFWQAVFSHIGKWNNARGGIVHGDTASTLFSALALRLAGVPVIHVEAGLRSPRLLEPFPEELIRRLVSRMATLHLAPDATSADNLRWKSGQGSRASAGKAAMRSFRSIAMKT